MLSRQLSPLLQQQPVVATRLLESTTKALFTHAVDTSDDNGIDAVAHGGERNAAGFLLAVAIVVDHERKVGDVGAGVHRQRGV